MSDLNPDPMLVRQLAERELRIEGFREAVEVEKARLRALTPWSRFLAWLPFTITWKSK